MTADSTISFSHFHGARSVPSTTDLAPARRHPRPRGPSWRRVDGGIRLVRDCLDRCETGEQIVGRRRHRRARGRAAPAVRHLDEGEVLGKARRRQPLDRACQQREEGAAGGMRAAGAAVEPRRDAGARERMLEQADVVAAATRSSTAISSNGTPARGFRRGCAARSRRLAPFAGRREQPDVAVGRARAADGREHVALERVRSDVAGRLEHLWAEARVSSKLIERREVAERHRDEDVRGRRDQSPRPARTRPPNRSARRAAAAAVA